MKKKIHVLFTYLLISLVALVACTPAPAPVPTEAPATEVPPTEILATPTTYFTPTPVPDPLTVTDDLGTDLSLEGPAQRIVSLSPSMTEILFAIGAGDRLVGRDSNSLFPEEAQQVKDLGGMWEGLPTEDILALEPDLVLAAEIISQDQVGQLAELGLNVFWQANPDDFAGLYENILQIAVLTGNEDEAEALVSSLEVRIAALDETLAAVEEQPLVFYELDATDPTNPWTTGAGTFISYIIAKAQGKNLGDALEGDWAQISSEEVVAQNPDYILLADAMYGTTPESVAERAGWEEITAVKEGNIHPFDPSILSVPGPRLVDGYQQMAEIIHPELFAE